MAQNVFSGHALGMPWSNFGAKIFRIFFLQNYANWSMESPKMQKKKFEKFFPIVAHLGHPGLTLRKFFENYSKNHFFEFWQKTALRIFLIFCMELDINKDYKLAQTPFSERSRLGGYGAQKGPKMAKNMTHLTLT